MIDPGLGSGWLGAAAVTGAGFTVVTGVEFAGPTVVMLEFTGVTGAGFAAGTVVGFAGLTGVGLTVLPRTTGPPVFEAPLPPDWAVAPPDCAGAIELPAVTSADVGAAALDAVDIAVVATCDELVSAAELALVGSTLPMVIVVTPTAARLCLVSVVARPKPPSARMATAAMARAAHFFPLPRSAAIGSAGAGGAFALITVCASASAATGTASTVRWIVVSSLTPLSVSGERSIVPSGTGIGAAPRAKSGF